MTRKILFVDDDPNLLQGFARQLRKKYEVQTAVCGDEGLKAVRECGPFAVVVSDMQMPSMDGIEFLTEVRALAPDTVRLMLTGNADQHTAAEAVNEGHIFRFLNKPCSADRVAQALDAALEQYRLVSSERELLTKTLNGSVGVLTEILALVNPRAFGRAVEVRSLVRRICRHLRLDNGWEIELAALLAGVGCITVAESTIAKIDNGVPVSPSERESYVNHPTVGSKLVARIPRLEQVAEMIGYQLKDFDGGGFPEDGRSGEEIPLGARILRVAVDFDALRSANNTDEEAMAIIFGRRNCYDPNLVNALASVVQTKYVVIPIPLGKLTDDMVLDQHIYALTGEILVSQGRHVAQVLIERLREFDRNKGVRQPIYVRQTLTVDEGNQRPVRIAHEAEFTR